MPKLFKSNSRMDRILNWFVLLVAGFSVIIVLVTMLLRSKYPFQLEWMEGGEIEHITRLINGKPIYCEPSLDFIPYIYTPLFYYIGAGISLLFAPSFFSIRLISIISFVISLFFIYKIVSIKTQQYFWGLVAVAIYALSYSTTGFWFDLARVDTLANLFLILSFYFLLKEDRRSVIISAFFSFFAFYTKQSYLLVTIFLLVPLFIRNKNLGWGFFSVYLTLIVVSTLVETIVSNGWYFFWNFYLPATHHWIWNRAITFWTVDILPYYSISFACIFSLILIEKREALRNDLSYFIFLFFGTMISSYFLRLHYGGFLNVLIPFVFAISVFFPVALNEIQKKLILNENTRILLYMLVLVQFSLLVFDPVYPIPKENDKRDVEQVLSFAKSIDGEVYLMGYNFVQNYFGLPSHPHYVLLNDLFISNVPQKQKVVQEFESALQDKKFKAIILDEDLKLDYLEKYYTKTDKVFYHRVLNSKSSPIRKEVVLVPKTNLK